MTAKVLRRLLVLLAGAVLLAACGSERAGPRGRDGSTTTSGRSRELDVEVASYDLAVGPPARFIAGTLVPDEKTGDPRLVAFGTVRMEFSFLGTGQAAPANSLRLPAVDAQFLSLPGTTPPSPPPASPQVASGEVGRGVYAAIVGFPAAGFWQVDVTANVDGRERRGNGRFQVGEKHAVPAPGDTAISTENPTLSSSDVPKAAIDSRATTGDIPDPELHRTSIAAALAAHRPAVVVFATPVYCQSRFCGPVTDMVQQLAHDYADRASFVHVEIYRDFQAQQLNQAVTDWHLENEPWVFVIGADGKIAARFDNVATRDEIEPLLKALPVIGPA